MTDDEKKKLFDKFLEPDAKKDYDDDVIENDWTEEEIIEATKKLWKRLGIQI